MRKLHLIVLLAMLCVVSANGQMMNCCTKPSDMQAMALNIDFKASHKSPIPFKYELAKGSMITYHCNDGKDANAYFLPSDAATNKVLIIFHEWWGLNDYIKKEADKWQALLGNVDVYAIDMYDGKVATDPDIASGLASGLDPKRADNIINGLLSKIGPDRQVATLGWCMGGAWSFRATVLATNQAAACVMYYGFPEKEDKNIKPQADVLYILGDKDKFIKQPFVEEFGDKIKAGGHKFTLFVYDGVHAFANPSNPDYNSLSATKAQNESLKFLKEKLELQ